MNKPLKSIQQSKQDEHRLEHRMLLLCIEQSRRHSENLLLDRDIKSKKASCVGVKEMYSEKKICLVSLGPSLPK